jgi:nucleotide-binding universal stress UspA family protein
MERFLIPLDFTETSANALRYAFGLNKHYFAQLHALHVFDVPFSASLENDAGMVEYERIRNSFTDKVWNFIADNKGDYHYDTVVSATSGGDLQSIVNYVEENDIHMVILGNKGKSGLGRWFFGTVTRNLLRHPPCMVLSVPATCQWKEITKVMVCTDLSMPLTPEQCTELKQFAEHTKAELEFLHVQDKIEIALPEDSISVDMIQKEFNVSPVTIPFRNSIAASVNDHIAANGGDLAVTLPHHHTWLDKLFLGSETAHMSDELSVPLLSLKGMKK